MRRCSPFCRKEPFQTESLPDRRRCQHLPISLHAGRIHTQLTSRLKQSVQPAQSLCSGFDQHTGFQLSRRIVCIIFTETNHFSSAISRPIPGRNIKECLTDIKLQTASVPLSINWSINQSMNQWTLVDRLINWPVSESMYPCRSFDQLTSQWINQSVSQLIFSQ